MIYLKRLLFLIVVIPTFSLGILMLILCLLLSPIYVMAYYIRFGRVSCVYAVCDRILDILFWFIDKINPDHEIVDCQR